MAGMSGCTRMRTSQGTVIVWRSVRRTIARLATRMTSFGPPCVICQHRRRRNSGNMKLSEQQLRDKLASNPGLARRNPELCGSANTSWIHPVEPEPVKRKPLVRRIPRKETSGPRFEIIFNIYAVRPCDFDGWHVKPLLDMVVHAGIIPGDSWDQLEGSIRSRKVSTKEQERTEIDIVRLT